MAVQTKEMYKCRNSTCNKPANGDYSCCSKSCRMSIPNCIEPCCANATEPGIYKGIDIYSQKCYTHGGRTEYHGETVNYPRQKLLCVNTRTGWQIVKQYN
jgi:hypothetical protein